MCAYFHWRLRRLCTSVDSKSLTCAEDELYFSKKAMSHVVFFHQDHLGLKVKKASWDVMGKLAPAELKVNHKGKSLLHKWIFLYMQTVAVFFHFTFPGLKGDIGDPGPRGPNGDPGCTHSPLYTIFCSARWDQLKTSLSTEQEFLASAHR